MSIRLRRLIGRLLTIPLAVALLLSVPAVTAAGGLTAVPGAGGAPVSGTDQTPARETAADYALFLKDKFGIAFGDTIAKGDFIAATATALRLLTGEDNAALTEAVFDDIPASSPYYETAAALYRAGIISGGAVSPGRGCRRSTPRRSRSRRPA